jgi:hypothetical protein
LIFLALYIAALLWATVASAQPLVVVEPDSFAVFFWRRIDWSSFGTAAFISLVAGAIRTGATLLNKEPTRRVMLEGVGDAFMSLVVGAVAFLILMIYQVLRSPVNPWVMFGFVFGAGLLRGTFLSLVEDTVKRVMGNAADAVVAFAANRFTALAASRAAAAPPKDTQP